MQDHPGHFGFVASLPLPETDGAVSEIGYAFDALGADGAILDPNANGIYSATSG